MDTINCKIEIIDETKKVINIIKLSGGAASRRLCQLLARRGAKHKDRGLEVWPVRTRGGRYDYKIKACDRFDSGWVYNYTFTGSIVNDTAEFL